MYFTSQFLFFFFTESQVMFGLSILILTDTGNVFFYLIPGLSASLVWLTVESHLLMKCICVVDTHITHLFFLPFRF